MCLAFQQGSVGLRWRRFAAAAALAGLAGCAAGRIPVPEAVAREKAALCAEAAASDALPQRILLAMHGRRGCEELRWQVVPRAVTTVRLDRQDLVDTLALAADTRPLMESILGGKQLGIVARSAFAPRGVEVVYRGLVHPAVQGVEAVQVERCTYSLQGPSELDCAGWCTPGLFAVPALEPGGEAERPRLAYHASDLLTGIGAIACIQDLIGAIYNARHLDGLLEEVPFGTRVAAGMRYVGGARPELLVDITRLRQVGADLYEIPCSLTLGDLYLVDGVLTIRGAGMRVDNLLGFVAFVAWLPSRPETWFKIAAEAPDLPGRLAWLPR